MLDRIVQLFSFRGTLSRQDWLIIFGLVLSVFLLLFSVDRYGLLPLRAIGALQTLSMAILLAACVRRLRDLGIAWGWFILANFLALVGGPLLFSLTVSVLGAGAILSMNADGMPDPAAMDRISGFGHVLEAIGGYGLVGLVMVLPAVPLFILLLMMALRPGKGDPTIRAVRPVGSGPLPRPTRPAQSFGRQNL